MPWKETNLMSLRLEFASLARQEGANVRELCRRFQISPATAYKWLTRFAEGGAEALKNRSPRPLTSPKQTATAIEPLIVAAREEHPAGGARKLKACLAWRGHTDLPAASTVQAVLRRHNLIDAAESATHRPFKRFEHPQPNALWQMDFKGHFALLSFRNRSFRLPKAFKGYPVGLNPMEIDGSFEVYLATHRITQIQLD